MKQPFLITSLLGIMWIGGTALPAPGGEKPLYTGPVSGSVHAVLGGVGTGCFEVLADGRFGGITYQNNPDRPLNDPAGCFAALWVSGPAGTQAQGLYRDPSGSRPVETVEIEPSFPLVQVAYKDPELPVQVRMEALSPIVPLQENESCLPAVVLRFWVKNPMPQPADVAVAVSWRNLIGLGGTAELIFAPTGELVQEVIKRGRLSGIRFSGQLASSQPWNQNAFGDTVLVYQSGKNETVSCLPAWTPEESPAAFWEPFGKNGGFAKAPSPSKHALNGPLRPAAAVAARQTIGAGQEEAFVFILAWHMPHRIGAGNADFGVYYANRWDSALSAAEDTANQWPERRKRIESWRKGYLDSSLPEWLVHRMFNSMGTLARDGVYLKDGRFAFLTHDPNFPGNLGSPEERLVAMPFLLQYYPQLLRSELDLFTSVQMANGEVPSAAGNLYGAIGKGDIPGGFAGRADSTAAFLLMAYEYCLWTGDQAYLEKMFPHLRFATLWLLNRDSNGDGLPDGASLWPWSREGMTSLFLADLYLAALRVGENLGQLFKDFELLNWCQQQREAAALALNNQLWNGNYYNLYYLPSDPVFPESALSVPGALGGEWYALSQGWNLFLKPERVTRALQDLSNRVMDDPGYLAGLAQNPGALPCIRYGYGPYWTAASLIRVGNPEAGLRMIRQQPEETTLHAETGAWAVAAALSGIGADRPQGCLIVGPSRPANASSFTVPFQTPHYSGAIHHTVSPLSSQQQCGIRFERVPGRKENELRQIAYQIPIPLDANAMILRVLLNGVPLAGQDFSREHTRVFGLQPEIKPREGDTLTLILAPKEGPRLRVNLEKQEIHNLGGKCNLRQIPGSPTGTSFYATNLLSQWQVVNLDITQSGKKPYKVFINGEERALPIPSPEPVPLLLPASEIRREEFEELQWFQWACQETAIHLAKSPGHNEVLNRLWKLQDQVNAVSDQDARQRGIRVDLVPGPEAAQFKIPESRKTGDPLPEAYKKIKIQIGEFLNELPALTRDPVLASEITGFFVPVALQVSHGEIVKNSPTFPVRAEVRNTLLTPLKLRVSLEPPAGWESVTRDPAEFDDREEPAREHSITFQVTTPADLWAARHILQVSVSGTWKDQPFRRIHAFSVGHDFIKKWLVVGPFPNERGEGFDTLYPPEINIKPSEKYEKYGRPAEWRVKEFPEGYVDFGGAIPAGGPAVAYAYTGIYSPREQGVQLHLGCQGDVKLFLNYKEIYAQRGLNQPAPGGERAPFRLFEGWNHLVVKVTKGSGPWGFYLELTDLQDLPLPDLQFALDKAE
ncbi:MAG: GH116 family glycosyl-hydrolase [bacterium]